jgi:excisionase family DNA binding protein
MNANVPKNRSSESDTDTGRPDSEFPEVMTAKQAADYLQINTQVLYRYIRDGLIPVARVGKTVRLKKSVIDRWLELSSWESMRPETRHERRHGPEPSDDQ